MEQNYTINDIETLSFKDGVRQRIAMYLGSADMQGVYNAIQEIISNSIDEYYMGYGNKIEIGVSHAPEGELITITDHARGIPFGVKPDGSNVLVDIFSKPHTGGKFNDKVYNSVAGLNGIGAKATCLSSLKFAVSVVRDGKHAIAKWEKGVLISYEEQPYHDKKATGTSIQFIPDPEVYNLEPIKVDFDVLCGRCKNLSYLTKGLTFDLFHHNGKQEIKKTYCAKNGLLDLIKDNAEKAIHSNPAYHIIKEDNIECEVALMWTKGKERSFTFTNGLCQSEGGTSLTGVKTAITNFVKKQFKGEFDGDLARAGLVYAISCKIPNPSFANQTKTKINNPELRGIAQRATGTALDTFMNRRPNDFKAVMDALATERKAEQAAERARRAVLEKVKEGLEEGKCARALGLTAEEAAQIEESRLLTLKPIIYVANISEGEVSGEYENNPGYLKLKEHAMSEGSEIIAVSAQIEAELAELEGEEKMSFLADLGIEESGLDKLIKSGYSLLGLISFLTAGPKEVRAWTIKRGTKAPGAAGKIHTDFERGFIRAEVVAFDALMEKGSYVACKEAGLVRSEGKEYVMQDGDIVLFRFNV